MKIYSKLKIRHKLVIIYLVLSVPIGILLYLLIHEKQIAIDFTRKEINGTAYLRPLRDIITYSYLSLSVFQPARSAVTPFRARDYAQIEKSIDSLEKYEAHPENSAGPVPDTAKGFAALRKQWFSLKALGENIDPVDMDIMLKELADQASSLFAHVGETSNLILDSDLDTSYLMETLVVKLMDITNQLVALEELVSKCMEHSLEEKDKAHIIITVANIKSDIEAVRRNMIAAMDNNPAGNLRPAIEKILREKLSAIGNYSTDAQTSLLQLSESASSAPIASSGKKATLENLTLSGRKILKENEALWDILAENLDDLLHNRVEGLRSKEYKAVSFVIVMMVLSTILIIVIIRGINGSISGIVFTLRHLNNDLTKKVPITCNDEIGDLALIFNEHLCDMNKIVATVKRSVDDVNNSVKTIMSEIEQQSVTITEQSAAVSEISATIEELSTSSSVIDEHSHDVAETASNTLENVLHGKVSMENVVENMELIKNDNAGSINEIVALGKESKEITKIMEIINKIADNTKLIAFNAALEASGSASSASSASSAGESGRRFGVVAIEVRRLAEHVMQSIEEIDTRIAGIQKLVNKLVIASEKGSKNIHDGLDTTKATYSFLDRVLEGSHAMAGSSKQISISTGRQKTAIEQTLNAIRDIDEGIRVASASIGLITQNVRSLSEFTATLEKVVGSFKIKAE
ncbi:MAG: methyl-accepting chemotaxis protein [Nitrospirae bacterium]|nr:methyl-accepting chemotaxis protein [Nitrospirota bacterium]